MREQEGNNVDWSIEGMPDPDDWKEQHKGDDFHHENGLGDLEYPDLYNNANTPEEDGSMKPATFRYKGRKNMLQDQVAPDPEVLHPGVQPNTLKPSDLASGGADMEEDAPEPMAPMPPYLNTEASDEVPTVYRAFYPKGGPKTYANEQAIGDGCVPIKDLPYIRSLAPSKVQDDYCVPAKFLPYYHPDTTPGMAQPSAGGAGGGVQAIVSSPQFDLPMPYAHGPQFPAFRPPGPGEATINPPPTIPLPAPADFNGNARRTPAMPMPPLPPAMWPYG